MLRRCRHGRRQVRRDDGDDTGRELGTGAFRVGGAVRRNRCRRYCRSSTTALLTHKAHDILLVAAVDPRFDHDDHIGCTAFDYVDGHRQLRAGNDLTIGRVRHDALSDIRQEEAQPRGSHCCRITLPVSVPAKHVFARFPTARRRLAQHTTLRQLLDVSVSTHALTTGALVHVITRGCSKGCNCDERGGVAREIAHELIISEGPRATASCQYDLNITPLDIDLLLRGKRCDNIRYRCIDGDGD